jgi:hypothetical protein
MIEAQKRRGCLSRLLTYGVIFLILAIVFTAIVYRRIGGSEGFKRWLANQTLGSIEKQIIAEKIYDISKDELENTFKQVKRANSQAMTDLGKLYQILRNYQQRFRERKPSVNEVNEFLEQLRSTIISDLEE